MQMPSLVPTVRMEELRSRMTGAAQPRMLREIAEALDALGKLRRFVTEHADPALKEWTQDKLKAA
jgi:hypothetical protein